MTPHIEAKQGDIAETVLLPGDPKRAKWAAETFLDAPRLVNNVRGMVGMTGTWRGNPVTIHGTGMGMPSLSIYVNELIRTYDAQTLIRIGSCGAMQKHINIRDIIVAQAACSGSNINRDVFAGLQFAPIANWSLLNHAAAIITKRNHALHVGNIFSSDAFYAPDLTGAKALEAHGVLGVEMEAAELYTLAARYQRRALAICTVSDHLITGEELPPQDREQSFGEMVEIALEAAFA